MFRTVTKAVEQFEGSDEGKGLTRKHCNVFHGYYNIFLRPITWWNAYLSSFFVSTASPLSSELRTFVIFLNPFFTFSLST